MSPLVGILALGSLFEQALQPLQHVQPPPGIASLSAAACASCHPDAYAQWQGTRHAHAYDNRIFLSSFRREPAPWCIYCHAPLPAQARAALGPPQQRVAEPLLHEGINCATCHVRDGAILSARPPTAPGIAAHPMRYEPVLGKSEFCGGCHQFNFPRDGATFHYSDTPIQNTLSEWQRTTRKTDCQDCHMPRGEHRFPGGHDAALLREHLRLAVKRTRATGLQVTLSARGIGHNLPTGDPFRRLRLEVFAEGTWELQPLVLLFRRSYNRTPTGWSLAQDTTLPAPGPSGESRRVVTVALPEELRSGAPLHYRLIYAYAAPSTEPELRPEDRSVELTSGSIK